MNRKSTLVSSVTSMTLSTTNAVPLENTTCWQGSGVDVYALVRL